MYYLRTYPYFTETQITELVRFCPWLVELLPKIMLLLPPLFGILLPVLYTAVVAAAAAADDEALFEQPLDSSDWLFRNRNTSEWAPTTVY